VLFVYDWNWDDARREFTRSIALDPQYATAHQWYAFLLASRGQMDRALVEGHTAQELDPTSVSVRRTLGWLYYYARRYEQARYHLARAVAMNPAAEETLRVLGLTLAVEGRPDEAERILRDAVGMPGAGSYTLATLGYALARAGRHRDAEAVLAELDARAEQEYVSPVAFATLLIGLGRVEAALDWAERAHDERRGWLAYLDTNPLVDPLRGHPRFEALAAKMRG
jgi:tetratricopeptide (TPR) repeat protein